MSITVLMYHHILPKSGFITSSVEEFESQMKFLSINDYKTLTPSEFLSYKRGEIALPKKSVLITFDDGWRDNFYFAYPILKKYSLKATIFLVTGWIEEASKKTANFTPLCHSKAKELAPKFPSSIFLNWNEIEKMTDVFSFHSHTNGHNDKYFESFKFEDDLCLCKQIIKNRLGFDDIQLCWPRGQYDDEKLNIAKGLGYEIFYTTKRGINKNDLNLDEIKRIAVKRDDKWLKKTLFIYQNDILGKIYSIIKK